MKWDGRTPAVGMAELFVRTTLPDFGETVLLQQLHDLAGFKDRN